MPQKVVPLFDARRLQQRKLYHRAMLNWLEKADEQEIDGFQELLESDAAQGVSTIAFVARAYQHPLTRQDLPQGLVQQLMVAEWQPDAIVGAAA